MKQVKCPNCGANIRIEEGKMSAICEFCDSTFLAENSSNQSNTSSNNDTKVINNYITNSTTISKRPVLHMWVAVLLILFSFWLGIIYIIYIKHLQKKWDTNHYLR